MRYAILGDIHANLQALEAVLDKCKHEGVEKYICVGDIVGYNANPSECFEIIRAKDLVGVVKGNHDEYVSNDDENMLGFNPHAKAAVLWTKAHLDPKQRQWLARLKLKQIVQGANITIVHATLDSPESWGYIFDVYHAQDNFSYQFTTLCFCGHSHVPVAFSKMPFAPAGGLAVEEIKDWKDGNGSLHPNNSDTRTAVLADVPPDPVIKIQKGYKYLINVGSVGQPRNHDPRASFAIYDSDKNIIVRHRVQYDIASAQKSILEAGLPERLAQRLERGN